MRNRDYHKKQSVKYGSEYHWRLYHGPPGTKSILKFGKVNLVITAKKLANVIKTIQKLLGKLLILLLIVPGKTKHIIRNVMKIYLKLLINSPNIGPIIASEVLNQSTNKVETYLENNKLIIPSFRFMFIPVDNVLKTP